MEYDDWIGVMQMHCSLELSGKRIFFLPCGKYFYLPFGISHLNARFIWLFPPFK